MNRNVQKGVRLLILTAILAFIMIEGYIHIKLGGQAAPSVHALCPYGAIESLFALIFSGQYIQKIFSGTLILLLVTSLITIFFRRAFCGYICPFGAMQELFAKLGQIIFKRRLQVPIKIDKPFRYLKYVILVFTVFMAWKTAELWIAPYDPYSAMTHIFNPSELIAESLIGLILLAITIIGSLLYDRFFCKYMCPAGAFYALIGKISPTRVSRNKDICINCKKCSKVCPVNIPVAEMEEVKTAECINCNECVNSCPKAGALEVKTLGKKKIGIWLYMILVLVIFFGTIAVTSIMGIFVVKNEPIKQGDLVSNINGEIKYDVSLIKGSTKIADVIAGTRMTKNEFYTLIGIDMSVPENIMIKEISQYNPDITPEVVREKLDSDYVEEFIQ